MGRRSRRIGKEGELEVARILKAATGREFKRNLEETRHGEGHDLVNPLPLLVQVKKGKAPPWKAGLREVVEAAEGTGQHPLCVTIETRGRGRESLRVAHLPLDDLAEILGLLTSQDLW